MPDDNHDFCGERPLAESIPCIPDACAAAFVGVHTYEGGGKRVEDEDLGEVRCCLYLHTLAALDDHITWNQAWLRGVAREMVWECAEVRCAKLGVDLHLLTSVLLLRSPKLHTGRCTRWSRPSEQLHLMPPEPMPSLLTARFAGLCMAVHGCAKGVLFYGCVNHCRFLTLPVVYACLRCVLVIAGVCSGHLPGSLPYLWLAPLSRTGLDWLLCPFKLPCSCCLLPCPSCISFGLCCLRT